MQTAGNIFGHIRLAILLAIGLQLFISFSSELRAQTENVDFLPGKPSAEIPFRCINNLILIPVLLNNTIPLEFILDTGVRTPILTERLYSDLLNINYDRVLSLSGAGEGESVQAYMASNVKMRLTNVQVQNQPMLILEEDYLQLGKLLGVPVHGIIGYELFARFVVKIDYEKSIITLYEPDKFKAPRAYERLELTIEGSKPFMNVTVVDELGKKHTLKLLVDTGASHALLVHDGKTDVQLPEKNIYGNLGRGLLGDINGHISRMPELTIADNSFYSVLTSFPEQGSYTLRSTEKERDGTLGGELLSRFSVIFDYHHSAIYLRSNRYSAKPFIFNKTGLTFFAQGDYLNRIEVIDIRTGSVGEQAGIKKGDFLLKINGKSASELKLEGISTILRRKDGKKVRMLLLRNGEKIKTSFRLKDLI